MSGFDYIIVGAGSAGCVLANRLSANPDISVCLIEAGPKDSNPAIHIPFGIALLNHFKSINWSLDTEEEPHLSNRSLYWPRGKTLGGSSSINAMCYIRGNPQNYDDWARQGCKDWDWNSVLPYFRRAENNSRGISKLHGANGPQSVTDLNYVNPLTLEFIEAGKQLGMSENPDFNGITQQGIGVYQVTHKNGTRCSSAKGYLNDGVKNRSNLTIMTEVTVEKIILTGKQATGVQLFADGETRQIIANQEVILSAGAVHSPFLLLKSGIGPKSALQDAGIECVHENNHVGKNLQDHLDVTVLFRQQRIDSYGFSVRRIVKDSITPYQYWRHRSGMLSSNVAEGAAFFKSDKSKELPDIQVHFLPALLVDHGRQQKWGHGFTIHVCNLYPKSIGEITLKQTPNGLQPSIHANYLSHEEDIKPMISAVKWARNIGNTPPLSNDSNEYIPGADIRSDEQIEEYIREHAETLYHPVGTCKMGPVDNEDSVVDTQLNVIGVDGLRVVDASIMPSIVGGNTNAPTIMIAEKAADYILQTLNQKAKMTTA